MTQVMSLIVITKRQFQSTSRVLQQTTRGQITTLQLVLVQTDKVLYLVSKPSIIAMDLWQQRLP